MTPSLGTPGLKDIHDDGGLSEDGSGHERVTLPTGSDGEGCVEAVAVVERPVVDDLGVVLGDGEGPAVDVELGVGELDRDGVVVPLVVADLGQLPAEFRRPEALQVAVAELAAQQQNQPAVAHEQRKVVPVHLCAILFFIVINVPSFYRVFPKFLSVCVPCGSKMPSTFRDVDH